MISRRSRPRISRVRLRGLSNDSNSWRSKLHTPPMNPKDPNAAKPQLNPTLKLVLDLGPLVLFFLANSRPALFLPFVSPILPADIASGERVGIFVATAVFMVAIVAALVVSYALTRHLPVMPLVTAVIVLVFGSLT